MKNTIRSILPPEMRKEGKFGTTISSINIDTHLIIGAGISGIELAKIYSKNKIAFIIIERNDYMGGIWVNTTNFESRPQVDPICFRSEDDNYPVVLSGKGDFDSIYPYAPTILKNMGRELIKYDIHKYIIYNTEIINFNKNHDQTVNVVLKSKGTGEITTINVKGLHIRTGDLSTPKKILFSGESSFSGKIAKGLSNDINLGEFKDKKVLIIGLASSAVENTRRALMGNAKSVTILSRNFNKPLLTEYATYLSSLRVHNIDKHDKKYFIKMWREIHDIIDKTASVTGMSDIVLNDKCIKKIDGEKHFIFDKALPSLASNIIYLGYYYNLINFIQGEVSSIDKSEIILSNGDKISADIIIKCIGFDSEDNCILKKHQLTNLLFVDDQPNITHNLLGDRVLKKDIIGSSISAADSLILSYFKASRFFDKTTLHLRSNIKTYEKLKNTNPKLPHQPLKIDYFHYLKMANKLENIDDFRINEIIENYIKIGKKQYENILPELSFLKEDKKSWDKLSHNFSKRSGVKKILDYPFNNKIKEIESIKKSEQRGNKGDAIRMALT